MSSSSPVRKPVVLPPGGGRNYPMGRIQAVFKADGTETQDRYSIGPCLVGDIARAREIHRAPRRGKFYVLAGTMSMLLGETWHDAQAGSFVLVPGGVTHDFQNRGDVRAGVLNFSVPGGFEPHMPGISDWFAENPPGDPGD